jgi:hypothetical protein
MIDNMKKKRSLLVNVAGQTPNRSPNSATGSSPVCLHVWYTDSGRVRERKLIYPQLLVLCTIAIEAAHGVGVECGCS